ncbi:MAG: 3'(2'),5'-bisphosphate nucleotidase CysQ, partial [Deltaproteobacteria bacterium]|nr:3'(2'),5'-bisphosphate nucleotidase CysQ [Deltaproteobacteria bacterium]
MLDRELVEAVMIVEQAGDMLLKFYNSTQKVHFKAGAEPVTQADTEVNDFVVTKLRRLFPNDGIVAEESGGEVTPTRSGRFWYIDPLD